MVDTRVVTGLSFSVLGPLAANRDGRPLDLGAPKQRALLAVLLADPNKAHEGWIFSGSHRIQIR